MEVSNNGSKRTNSSETQGRGENAPDGDEDAGAARRARTFSLVVSKELGPERSRDRRVGPVHCNPKNAGRGIDKMRQERSQTLM